MTHSLSLRKQNTYSTYIHTVQKYPISQTGSMATWLLHFLNIFYLHSKACSFVYIWTKNCKSFIFFIDAAATPYYNEWQRRRKKQHLLSSWDRLTSPMTLNSLSGRKWIGGIPSRISDEILKSLHSKLTLISFSSFFYLSPSVTPLSASPSHFRSREAWLHLGLW